MDEKNKTSDSTTPAGVFSRGGEIPQPGFGRIERKQLRDGEASILELISSGAPLSKILDTIARTMDAAAAGYRTSILIVGAGGQCLSTGAAPQLPPSFIESIDGLPIAEGSAVCGTAAHRRAPVYVEDVEIDPLCAAFSALAAEHNIRACWSVPVIDSHGAVIATLALYAGEPCLPTPTDIALLQRAAHLASIAIERARDEKSLRDNEALLRMALHIGRMGAWRLSLPDNQLTWSAEVYEIFEVPEDFQLTLENALTFYNEEQQRQIAEALERCSAEGTPFDLELPLTSAKGRSIWIRAMGEAVHNGHDEVLCIQGALQDITERKSSEHRAKLMEERLAKTLETISEAFITLDQDWRFNYINLEAERLLQRSRDSLLGSVVWEEYPQAGGPDFENAYRTAVETGRPVEFEAYYPGINCWFRVRAIPSAEGLAVYFNDVSETRKARETIAANEERFRLLSKATNDAIWDWDLQANTLWWNEGFETLFGYRRNEIPTSLSFWADQIHPDESQRVEDSLHEVIASQGQQWASEYRFRRKDGSYAYVLDRGYVQRDTSGKAFRMIGGMTDITERKQAELQLAEQAALIDQATDAILVRDLDNKILFWNHRAEVIYGWSRQEAIGSSVATLLYSDTTPLEESTKAVLRNGEWSGELQHLTQAGKVITVFCRWVLLRDSHGDPKSILAINSDITERKRLEQQLMRTQRMESIGTLAGGIAHDLNNILAPILMSADLLKDDLRSPESRAILDTLVTSASRGADLIKQVLGFARGIDGKPLLIDIGNTVHEIQKIIQDTFPRNIDLRVEKPTDLWRINADPTQLHQVVMNLCVNARDAMPGGGVLKVGVDNIIVDDVFAGMDLQAKPGPYICIRVSDTGIGMPRDIQEKIFEPFFTTKELGKGTGLGLSTTFTIVKNHGGFVNVYSEPGKGTKFKVYLPACVGVSNSKDLNDDIPAATAAPLGAGELILLVDDEAAVREITRKALERFGYQVITANNGAEGVSAYLQNRDKIDVVLTDMSMPVMDGPAMIVALKSIDPGVKIIGSSGLASNGDVAKALGAGVEHFVPKPYTAETLLKTLHLILKKGDADALSHARVVPQDSPGVAQDQYQREPQEISQGVVEKGAPRPQVGSTTGTGSRARVLLVDDDPILRGLAERMLKSGGCTVVCAENGSEALEMLAKVGDNIDIVITDLNMPLLGGADLYREAIRRYPHLRFIFASGSCAIPESLAEDVGPRLCSLPKPYSINELQQALHTVLIAQG